MPSGGQHEETKTAGIEPMAGAYVPELAALNSFLAPFSPMTVQADKCEQAVNVEDQSFAFDRRPGFLEATRGCSAEPMVYAHHDQAGEAAVWRVRVASRGTVLLALCSDQARRIAAELIAYADICDEGNGESAMQPFFDYFDGVVVRPDPMGGPSRLDLGEAGA